MYSTYVQLTCVRTGIMYMHVKPLDDDQLLHNQRAGVGAATITGTKHILYS